MANQDAAYGFRPVVGGDSNGPNNNKNALQGYSIASAYASDINYGDPVGKTGTADSIGRPGIQLVSTPGTILGVFAGVKYIDSSGEPQFKKNWTASTVATEVEALVFDDPEMTFSIQADEDIVAGDIGQKADYIHAAGVNGNSRVELDSSTITSGDSLLILGLDHTVEENNLGENYTKVLVKIREHEMASTLTAV